MTISVAWTDGEMQTVVAALVDGASPELTPGVAATIRAATPPSAGSTWVIHLDFNAGQRLKAWCDARRERAIEQDPNDTWTRIVARVNEAVQPFAPAKGPGPGPRSRVSGLSGYAPHETARRIDMAPERVANTGMGDESQARATLQESMSTGAALGETVKVGFDRAGALVKGAADKTRDRLAGYRDGEVFAHGLDDIVEFVRRQPITALLIATGVGLLVGTLLAQGRQAERG